MITNISTGFFNLLILMLLCSSCRVASKTDKLEEGYYESAYIKTNGKKVYRARDIYVEDTVGQIMLTKIEKNDTGRIADVYSPALNSTLHLTQRKFDIDVFTIPFKIRMTTQGFPAQLNSNFNAAVYLGQRYDFYKVSGTARIRNNIKRVNNTRGVGGGIFLGLGSATMNPFVTGNYINYEYDGLIFDAGLAAIYDAKVFNIGIAAGTDHLFDKNRKYWIYQNKIWLGVLFGLNLN